MSKPYYRTTLHDLLNTLIHQSIQWLDMFTLFCKTHSINISYETHDVPYDNNNENIFENEQEDIATQTMVQNILSFEQIYDYFKNVMIVHQAKIFSC